MSQSLPQWAIDGLAAAGLSAEGWMPKNAIRGAVFWVEYRINGYQHIAVFERGSVVVESREDDEIGSICFTREGGAGYPLPDAFRLASRLAAALGSKPDPRVAELERIILAYKSGESHVREVCAKAGFQTHHKGGVIPRDLASVVEDIVAERDRLRTALAELHQEGIYNLKVDAALSQQADRAVRGGPI